MLVQKNISLLPYNTFGIDVIAENLVIVKTFQDFQKLIQNPIINENKLILGGGSNILLTKNVEGLVIINQLRGIDKIDENDDHVWLKVMAGEVWHDFVLYAIEHQYGGIENLALIPGCVGAAPMQNIGAYGAEVKDTIESVEFWHWEEKQFKVFDKETCEFGYRESIFKKNFKGKIFITSVVFKLNKKHELNTDYGAIQSQLKAMGVHHPSIKTIVNAVIEIRQSKLPNPKQIGNAGSFFKNPTVSQNQFKTLRTNYPEMPHFEISTNEFKIPAGWLIEQCGWKGKRVGNTGVHANQALVLVNYGGATGSEIFKLSEKIIDSVLKQFEIQLEREVNIW